MRAWPLAAAGMVFAFHAALWETVVAQAVQGRVVDRLSGLPAGRGFVALVTEAGREVTRTLSDREGRFTIQAPGPGRYRLRSERIGYQLTTSEEIDLSSNELLRLTLQLEPIPIQLSAVDVSGEERRCGLGAAEGQGLALVWGEIRKVLNATVWTRSRPYLYVRQLNERTTGVAGQRVIREAQYADSGYYTEPFRSAPAGYLALKGYIVQDGDSLIYYAPDARLLLDDAFLESHCLRLTREPRARDQMIGVAFEPQSWQRSDVKGVLWVDERKSELVELQYNYVGGARHLSQEAGGVLRFLQLPSGDWIVSAWSIRTPVVVERTFRRLGIDVTDTTLTGVRELGGEVLRIRDANGSVVYASHTAALADVVPTGVLLGRVHDLISGLAVVGVVIRIDSAGIEARTDTAGAFSLGPVPLGAHRLQLRRVGYRPVDLRVTVRAGTAVRLPDSVLSLEPLAAVVLDTAIIEGIPVSRSLAGFYERRRRGMGSFLTRAEWESRGDPAQLIEVLLRMPGIVVIPNPNYMKAVRQVGGVDILDRRRWIVETSRGAGVSFRGPCAPIVYVDGSYFGPLRDDVELDDLAALANVEAIEVYRGGSQVPLEFNAPGAVCGVIVVWLRR